MAVEEGGGGVEMNSQDKSANGRKEDVPRRSPILVPRISLLPVPSSPLSCSREGKKRGPGDGGWRSLGYKSGSPATKPDVPLLSRKTNENTRKFKPSAQDLNTNKTMKT